MAADVVVEPRSMNPCCEKLREECSKLEANKNILRQTRKVLKDQLNHVLQENERLKKSCEEGHMQKELEKEAKEKESTIRENLEKELHDIKAQIPQYLKSEGSGSSFEDEIKRLESRLIEGESEVKRLRGLLEREKKRCDSEKKKTEEERKKAVQALELLAIERCTAEKERKLAETERNKAEECRRSLEKLKCEGNTIREKLILEKSKTDDAIKKVEAEKQKTYREKQLADSERKKAEEQKTLLEIERKKAIDGEVFIAHLSQQLEEEKQRKEGLQKMIEETKSFESGKRKCSCLGHGKSKNVIDSKAVSVKLLREQLKLEKKRVKYAKRIAQLEKAEKSFVGQQVNLLKQNVVQLSCRLGMLDDHLSCSTGGKDSLAKVEESRGLLDFNLQKQYFGIRPININLQGDLGMRNSHYNDSSNYSCSTKQCTDLPITGRSRARPMSGINSELESPIKQSCRNKLQNSAACSTSTMSSDRMFLGSQERDELLVTTSTNLRESTINQKSEVPKLAGELGKTMQIGNIGFIKEDKNYVQRKVGRVNMNSSVHDEIEITDGMTYQSTKKRKIQETLESIALLYSEDNQLRTKMGEKLSALTDFLSIKDSLTMLNHSHNCGSFSVLDNEKGILIDKTGDQPGLSCRAGTVIEERKQQKLDSRPFSQNFNQRQRETSGIRNSCFLSEIAAPNYNKLLEHINISRQESSNAISSHQTELLHFENMLAGDCLKLLELDDDDDERRFREALEMPLSPTLPEINFPRIEIYGEDESHYLVERLPRRSEFEKYKSESVHTFDILDLEIQSNMVKLKTHNAQELLSDNNIRLSLNQPKCGSLVTLHNNFDQIGMVHDTSRCSYLENSKYLDTDMCDAKGSDDFINLVDQELPIMMLSMHHWQDKSLAGSAFDPKIFDNSHIHADSLSREKEKYLSLGNVGHNFSNSTAHCKLLDEDKCARSYNLEIFNSETNEFSVADGQDKGPRTDQVPSPGWLKHHIEGEGNKHDDVVVTQCLNHGLNNPGTRKLSDGSNVADCQAVQMSIHLGSNSSTIAEVDKQMPFSTSTQFEDPCRSKNALKGSPKYCVFFSSTKGRKSIARIFHVMNTVNQNFMFQEDNDIAEIIRAITSIPDLLSGEKVSVFISLLLHNISGALLSNSKDVTNDDILRCSESFSVKIDRVISDGETGLLFQEIFQLEILLNLTEDFLINRKILTYNGMQSERVNPFVPTSNHQYLEEGNMCSSYRDATVDQVVAASIILTSFCASANHIGFLLEASYKLLRRCRNDTSWVLLVLHVFASVIGKKFFTLNNYCFLIVSIRSVVTLLERGHASLSSVSPCHSAYTLGFSFPPCEQCPFYTNTISVEKFTSLLLDVLHDNTSVVAYPSTKESDSSFVDKVSECIDIDDENADFNFGDIRINCDASCILFKYRKHATSQSDFVSERGFCHYTDIISLVELVGCYMSWEWTSNNILPRLMELLESRVSEEFIAALLVLIGQLVRFGIDAGGGYNQIGAAKLGCSSLSMFLNTFITTRKGSFRTQLCAIGALLNLLPFSFQEIVGASVEHSMDTIQSGQAELIKKWFFQLSRELQSFSLHHLQAKLM